MTTTPAFHFWFSPLEDRLKRINRAPDGYFHYAMVDGILVPYTHVSVLPERGQELLSEERYLGTGLPFTTTKEPIPQGELDAYNAFNLKYIRR